MAIDRGADFAEGRYRDAQFRGRADAICQIIFGWRRGAYCTADGSQRIKSCGGGCSRFSGGAGGILPFWIGRAAGSLLGNLLAARVADPAIFDVDDGDAAPISWK